MTDVIIVGDGPAGLSAALFLAKKDMDVIVFGKDETAMHYAMVYNYLGIKEITGSDFQKLAREQVAGLGADLQDKQVTAIARADGGFSITTEDGGSYSSKYLIIAEGKMAKLAKSIGLEEGESGIKYGPEYRTSIEGLYVIGRTAKPQRSQAIISAGAGAVAALDILALEAGHDVVDYDSVD